MKEQNSMTDVGKLWHQSFVAENWRYEVLLGMGRHVPGAGGMPAGSTGQGARPPGGAPKTESIPLMFESAGGSPRIPRKIFSARRAAFAPQPSSCAGNEYYADLCNEVLTGC